MGGLAGGGTLVQLSFYKKEIIKIMSTSQYADPSNLKF